MRCFPVALLPLALAGCLTAEDEHDVDPALESETASELGFGPTTLTFYQHANLTGTTYTTSLSSPDLEERIRLIARPDVEAAGLLGRISAVRLRCGTREARVVLFDAYNLSNTSFASWSYIGGSSTRIECLPGQTVTVNLHEQAPALADRVASAFLVHHAKDVGYQNFSTVINTFWQVALQELPSEATATGTEWRLTTTRTFRLRQRLRIDHWACTERNALFEYSVRMNEDHTFTATVTDTYVDYGFGDSLGCRDKIKSTLDAAVSSARTKVEDGLRYYIRFFVPGHARYYFVPDGSLREFDLFYGADVEEDPPVATQE